MPVSLTTDSGDFLCLPKLCNSNLSGDFKLFSLPLLITVAPVNQEKCDFSLGFWVAVVFVKASLCS